LESNVAAKSGLKISLESFGELGERRWDESAPILVDSRSKSLVNNDFLNPVKRELPPCGSLLERS
jgi:hypothetical protein